MTKSILSKVVLGWVALIAVIIGLGYPFVKSVQRFRNATSTETIWLPEKYVHANKGPDGSYGPITSTSVSGTAVSVPFDDMFKKRAARAERTDVIVTLEGVRYLARENGVVYNALWQPFRDDRWFVDYRAEEVAIINDNTATWVKSDWVALQWLCGLSMAGCFVAIFSRYKIVRLWEMTAFLLRKEPGAVAA